MHLYSGFSSDIEGFVLFKALEWVFHKWELMLNAPLTWLVSCLMRRRAVIYFCQWSLATGFSDLCRVAGLSAHCLVWQTGLAVMFWFEPKCWYRMSCKREAQEMGLDYTEVLTKIYLLFVLSIF